MRRAKVLMHGTWAGDILEEERSYRFSYRKEYLDREDARPVSVTLPLRAEPYDSPILHPFFDGLIPEGWVLAIAERNWKLKERDRMGLLLVCCADSIGAVSIEPFNVETDER
ncbi:MAG: HipA N-terminal domain-containing protein [Flavobacteriales bacterium]